MPARFAIGRGVRAYVTTAGAGVGRPAVRCIQPWLPFAQAARPNRHGGDHRHHFPLCRGLTVGPAGRAQQLPDLALFKDAVERHPDNVAIAVPDGEPLRYRDLIEAAAKLAAELDLGPGAGSSTPPAVAFLCPPGPSYVVAQWACWMAGGMAVPLHVGHPEPELRYCIATAEPAVVVAAAGSEHQIAAAAAEFGCPVRTVDPPGRSALVDPPEYAFAPLDRAGNAMMVFTSGTTGKPKGVVTTHRNIEHQVSDLVTAWEWSAADKIPHFLPLHHVHGIVNKLLCPLSVGATVEFVPASAKALWALLLGNSDRPEPDRFTLFMAVPTIYALMLKAMDEELSAAQRSAAAGSMQQLRLMVSGSAACPVPIMNRWEEVTGHRLLERYGMTELGMALSNPFKGDRIAGYVGLPLPSVEARLVDDETGDVLMSASGDSDGAIKAFADGDELQGNLEVRGGTVFKEYWRNPGATEKEFTRDGWFKTGDVAAFNVALQSFRICGRASIDIIKSGGYKISALDIERVLLEHPRIEQAAVVGHPDDTWGEVVAAALVWRHGTAAEATGREAVRAWLDGKIAAYKVPQLVEAVHELPKNAMGKVVKAEVKRVFARGVGGE